jgi:hypothetical protein
MSPSGGDGGAGARQEEEEQRKSELRRRIDRLYGIDYAEPLMPQAGGGGPIAKMLYSMADQVNPQVEARNAAAMSEAAAARAAMEAENTKLADATRGYYTDELGRNFEKAERGTRFKLARQGLLGGSEDVFQQGDVRQERDLGATRVDEAVRRAVANLTSQREQERLNAINLVNAGAGDSAVSAAQAGLRNSFENVSNEQKANLFSDLFANSADAMTANNLATNQALLAARYRDRLGAFFPARSTSSGRNTPSY